MINGMKRTASITKCGSYRWNLTRSWDDRPKLLVVMFNPSTADSSIDDPTITLLCHVAAHNGYGGIVVVNGIPLRSSAPEPVPTISAQGTHIAEVRAFLVKFYRDGGQWSGLGEPMHTIPTRDRMGLVTVHGQDYVIADIGMRMLQPRELARAQGFEDDYQLAIDYEGRPLSKSAQVRMVGNSVCPGLAAALVRENYVDRQALRRVA